jgi:hypothetical protein
MTIKRKVSKNVVQCKQWAETILNPVRIFHYDAVPSRHGVYLTSPGIWVSHMSCLANETQKRPKALRVLVLLSEVCPFLVLLEPSQWMASLLGKPERNVTQLSANYQMSCKRTANTGKNPEQTKQLPSRSIG